MWEEKDAIRCSMVIIHYNKNLLDYIYMWRSIGARMLKNVLESCVIYFKNFDIRGLG